MMFSAVSTVSYTVGAILKQNTKFFDLKRNQFLQCQSKTLNVASRPAGPNFGAPKNMGGLRFQVLGLRGLRGICFQGTLISLSSSVRYKFFKVSCKQLQYFQQS